MTIKKNIPYKFLKYLWISLIILTLLNIVGVWVGWTCRDTAEYVEIKGGVAFGVITGVFVLLNLIASSVVAFLNQNAEKRPHGWVYAALAVIHLIFVIVTFTIVRGQDNSCPTLFTVFLIAVLGVMVYLALARNKPGSIFGKKDGKSALASILGDDAEEKAPAAKVEEDKGSVVSL